MSGSYLPLNKATPNLYGSRLRRFRWAIAGGVLLLLSLAAVASYARQHGLRVWGSDVVTEVAPAPAPPPPRPPKLGRQLETLRLPAGRALNETTDHFPRRGLKENVWEALNALAFERVIIRPSVVPYAGQTAPSDPVQWEKRALFPAFPTDARTIKAQRAAAPPPNTVTVTVLPRDVDPTPHAVDMTKLPPLISSDDPFVIKEKAAQDLSMEGAPPPKTRPLFVPPPERLVFGFVTSVERARQMSGLWQHFLAPPDVDIAYDRDWPYEGQSALSEDKRSMSHPRSGKLPPGYARSMPDDRRLPQCLVLVSEKEDANEIAQLNALFRHRHINCHVKMSHHKRYEVRVLSMVQEFKQFSAERSQEFDWYIFNDDDTFWLDRNVLNRLLAKYDPSRPWFVGGTTEAFNQFNQFGRMAFGGAGILASRQMVDQMHSVWDECFRKFHTVFGGDEMLTRCAALASGETKSTVTTEEKGLHQFDIPGDNTGVFQSGIPLVNMHHYLGGSWVRLFGYGTYLNDFAQISLVKKAASFLGGDNIFRRHVFDDGHWLLTQGYSLTYFEQKLTPAQLRLMEHTWYEEYKLAFADRPAVSERHDHEGVLVKQTFYLDDVRILSQKQAVFTYAMADKWDEQFDGSLASRPRISVIWDECDKPSKQDRDSGLCRSPKSINWLDLVTHDNI